MWFMNNVVGVIMPLDMITLLGMIVLIGTVVNNPILLVEQARQNFKAGMEGKTLLWKTEQVGVQICYEIIFPRLSAYPI